MYRTLAILCFVATAYGLFLHGPLVPGLKYKLGPPGSDSILNLPLSNISASVRGYYLMNRPRLPGGYCPLQLWCRKDEFCRVCILTDETGDVAGLQINFPCSDFKPRFDMRELGFTIWTTSLDNQIVRFYAYFVFFVPPDSQKRIESKDVTVVLRDDKLYYSGFGGYLTSVTTNTSQLDSTAYVKQECVTFQGYGHYYNMTEDLECSASTLSPFSVSVYRDTLVSAKITVFGHFKKYSKYFKLFEDLNAVGIKLAESTTKLYYDPTAQGLIPWTCSANGKTYLTSLFFFVSEDKSTRTYNKDEVIQANNVAFLSINGILDYAPKDLKDIKKNDRSVWKKQSCVPWMGLHYYHSMTTSTTCDKPFVPYFGLYDNKTNQLIGVGFIVLGECVGDTNEHPDTSAVKMIVKNGPQCLYEKLDECKACTRHTYFVDNPHLIVC